MSCGAGGRVILSAFPELQCDCSRDGVSWVESKDLTRCKTGVERSAAINTPVTESSLQGLATTTTAPKPAAAASNFRGCACA